MTDAIDAFMEQHEEGLKQLDVLCKSTEELKAEGYSEGVMERVTSSLDFIDTEIREHNRNEEEFLFPLLDKFLPPQGPTDVMRGEHQELWDNLTVMQGLVGQLKKDRGNREVVKDLARSAGFVCGLLSAHIDKENNILFPMARKFLSQEQLVEIATNIS